MRGTAHRRDRRSPGRDVGLLRDATGDGRATTLVAGCELPARRDGDALVVDRPVFGLFEVAHIRRW